MKIYLNIIFEDLIHIELSSLGFNTNGLTIFYIYIYISGIYIFTPK